MEPDLFPEQVGISNLMSPEDRVKANDENDHLWEERACISRWSCIDPWTGTIWFRDQFNPLRRRFQIQTFKQALVIIGLSSTRACCPESLDWQDETFNCPARTGLH